MKKLLFLFSICALMFISNNLYAQGGNTGAPKIGVQAIQKCHTNVTEDTLTGFYQVYIYRVGKPDEQTLIGTKKADGTDYVIPGTGTVSLGTCQTGGGAIDSFDFTFDIVELCDGGATDFLRVYREKCNNITNICVTTLTDIDLSGTAYTVIGTVTKGSCNDVVYRSISPNVYDITTTQSFPLDKVSFEVLNVGTKLFTITTNAATITILPGGRWYCHAWFNEVTREIEYCPAVTVTGTGIEAQVTTVLKKT